MTRRTPPNPHATPAPRVDVAALAEYTAGVVRAVADNRLRRWREYRHDLRFPTAHTLAGKQRKRRT